MPEAEGDTLGGEDLDLDHGSDHTTIQQPAYLKLVMLAAHKLCLNKQKKEKQKLVLERLCFSTESALNK